MKKGTSRSQPAAEVILRLPDGGSVTTQHVRPNGLGGIFVETPSPFAFGTHVDVEFSMQGTEAIRCGGFVTSSRVEGGRLGAPGSGMTLRLTGIGLQDLQAVAVAFGDN